jgi:hypothetical protein
MPCVSRCAHIIHIQPTVAAQRILVLADLVALGQVGIKIVLAGKEAELANRTAESQPGLEGEFYRARIDHRQAARQGHAHRADVCVGLGSGVTANGGVLVNHRARTKHLGTGDGSAWTSRPMTGSQFCGI